MNVNAKVFVPSAATSMAVARHPSSFGGGVAIQFEGRMSAAEAFAVSKTLLYNPVCCEFCSNALRYVGIR